ncbi:MAG: carboxylating nicotinate-nucleotide diphosphorylase [bacterium]
MQHAPFFEDQATVQRMVAQALAEDIGTGDVTAALIPADKQVQATVICRDPAVLAGKQWFDSVFQQIDPRIEINWHYNEGDQIPENSVICQISGQARAVLSAERTALNFLQTLSATATATWQYVKKIQHTSTRILDTRKTLPNFRLAQKYAVRCGGGDNHRIGLYDRVLIKENHIIAAGSIVNAVQQARVLSPQLKVEVETENLAEVQQAIAAQADIIMLDNFPLAAMQAAVDLNRRNKSDTTPCLLEASGGISLSTVQAIAETGVDYISVGAITKHIQAVDLSLRLQ